MEQRLPPFMNPQRPRHARRWQRSPSSWVGARKEKVALLLIKTAFTWCTLGIRNWSRMECSFLRPTCSGGRVGSVLSAGIGGYRITSASSFGRLKGIHYLNTSGCTPLTRPKLQQERKRPPTSSSHPNDEETEHPLNLSLITIFQTLLALE